MKVTLLRTPSLFDSSASAVSICPPIGLAYLKSIIKEVTSDICVIDAVGNNPKIRTVQSSGKTRSMVGDTAEQIQSQIPIDTDLILVSIMFSQDWPYSREVLKAVHRITPRARIVVGGEHVTALPDYTLQQCPEVDACVMGEGELVLREFLNRWKTDGGFPTDVPGMWVRFPDGRLQDNGRMERVEKPSELPWPDWEGFPLSNYLDNGLGFGVNIGRSMPILATRGCPYRCTFCSIPTMWTNRWKERTPRDVLDEMKSYIQRYNISNFDFYDMTLIIKRSWIVEFCELVIREGLKFTWQLPSGSRSEAVDSEVARLLYQAGCRNLSFAPESGSPEVLKKIKKQINPDKMLDAMRACRDNKLSLKANIICGFPGERPKHLLETLKFITKMAWVGIDDMSINQFSPYPGNELFRELHEAGRVQLNDEFFESLLYYTSMTQAHSYSEHISDRMIVIFKQIGMMWFYGVNFLLHPFRVFRMISNLIRGVETTRLEKTLLYYIRGS